MINWKKLFKKEEPPKPKVWNLEEGHVIVPAFIDRGVQYYELKDVFNTFSKRALSAIQVYDEWDMRLNRQDLLDFILAFDNILRNPKEINLTAMVQVVGMLKERVNFPVPTEDMIYKLAAVRYFDENESPYMVDPDYMATKIARWKEAGSTVDPFFIVQRHVDMLPLPKLSEDGLKILLEAQKNVIESQLKSIRELSSQE